VLFALQRTFRTFKLHQWRPQRDADPQPLRSVACELGGQADAPVLESIAIRECSAIHAKAARAGANIDRRALLATLLYALSGRRKPTVRARSRPQLDVHVAVCMKADSALPDTVSEKYGRSFAAVAATSCGFSTGSSMISSSSTTPLPPGTGHLQAPAWGGSWTAQRRLRRGLQVPDGATSPVFLRQRVGHAGRHATATCTSAAARDRARHGRFAPDQRVTTASAAARVEFACTRRLAGVCGAFYYRYGFENGVGLPPELAAQP